MIMKQTCKKTQLFLQLWNILKLPEKIPAKVYNFQEAADREIKWHVT